MPILSRDVVERNADQLDPAGNDVHPAIAEVEVPRHYDLDAIKEALRVDAVLQEFGIYVDEDTKNMPCPLHNGTGQKSFSIFDEGRRWKCWSVCDESGDIFSLIIALAAVHGRRVTFLRAVELAAEWAEVGPSAAPTSAEMARHQAERDKRDALHAEELAIKRDGAARRAREEWIDAFNAWWNPRRGDRRKEICTRYLATRGIASVTNESHSNEFAATRYGEPLVPIYSFMTLASLDENPIVGLAWRQIQPGADPKVWVTAGCTTTGTFGQSRAVMWEFAKRIVIVEGVVDYLTALLVYSRSRGNLVLGAHAVGILPKIIPALADHVNDHVATAFRAKPLVFVTHVDESDAGAKAEAVMIQQAEERGMSWQTAKLEGHKDLNEWWVARLKARRQP